MKDIKQEMRKRFDKEFCSTNSFNEKEISIFRIKKNVPESIQSDLAYLREDLIYFIESEIDKAIVERDKEIVEMIEKENSQNQITQAILSVMEYRGFNDCGKYIDSDIWEKIKPIFINLINSK